MLCQNCGKNEATTHIKQIVNGDMAESHLCAECAQNLGYSDMLSGFGLDLSEFLGGCAECYRTFYDELLPSIQRIHGRIKHSGKASSGAIDQPKEETKEEKIAKLKTQMDEAVAAQEFEQAAKLRDEIKSLESEGGETK